MKSDLLYKLAMVLTALLPFVLLWWLRPYYALMDDANLLMYVERARDAGVLKVVFAEIAGDMTGWGMFRPVYWIYAWCVYSLGQLSPLLLYSITIIVVWASIGLFGLAMHQVWYLPLIRSGGGPADEWPSPPAYWMFFLLATVAFPWFFHLLVYSSLQEKLVLLAGAANLLYLHRATNLKPVVWLPGMLALMLLGFATKGQFAVFLLPMLLVLYDKSRSLRSFQLLAVFSAGVVGVIALKILGSHSGYTGAHSMANVLHNLQTSKSVWLFLLLFAASFALAWRTHGGILQQPRAYLPVAFLFSFLLLFLPWRLGGYLNSLMAPVFALVCLQGVLSLKLLRDRWHFLLPAIAPVLLLLFGLFLFRPWNDLSQLNRFLRSDALTKVGNNTVWMACEEGAHSVGVFTKLQRGLHLDVRYPLKTGTDPVEGKWQDGFDGSFATTQVFIDFPGCQHSWITNDLQIPWGEMFSEIIHREGGVELKRIRRISAAEQGIEP